MTFDVFILLIFAGPYEVKVKASNKLNSLTVTKSFYLCEKITQQDLSLSTYEISTNETLNIDVQIHNGNNVTIEIDYGDNTTPETRFILDSHPTGTETFNKS